jgi:hypothetical protein
MLLGNRTGWWEKWNEYSTIYLAVYEETQIIHAGQGQEIPP